MSAHLGHPAPPATAGPDSEAVLRPALQSPLAGRSAIVTGASSGIGRAIALALAAQRATVCLVGRDGKRLVSTARSAEASSPRDARAAGRPRPGRRGGRPGSPAASRACQARRARAQRRNRQARVLRPGGGQDLPDYVNADGIRVLSVYHLGRVATPTQRDLFARDGKPYDPALLLQPEDVAAMVIAALSLPHGAEVTDISMRPARKSY